MSGVHEGEVIPLLIVGSWSCTCHETHQETERDSLIARQRALALSLICFCFFPSSPHLPRSLPCHMLKVEPGEGNDKQRRLGRGQRGVGGWIEIGTQEGGCDTKESLSHSLRCWNIKVSSQVVIFLRKPRVEGDKWRERRREAGGWVIETRREERYHHWSLFPLFLDETRAHF